MRDHRKLRAFQLANNLTIEVYRLTRNFPREESFGLTSQMRRSALSIAANIVEGEARKSPRDLLRFLNMAFGSARELGYYIELSKHLGFVSELEEKHFGALHLETIRVLHGFLKALEVRSASA